MTTIHHEYSTPHLEGTVTTSTPTHPYPSTSLPLSYVPNMPRLKLLGKYSENVNIRPAEAAHLLTAWDYHRQRNIRAIRLSDYTEQMNTGNWIFSTEMHVGVLPDGTCYLLNGYHRLSALVRTKPEVEFSLPVTLIYTLMQTEQELADYYAVIDNLGVRSAGDAIKAQGIAAEWGISVELLKAGTSASVLIGSNFSGGRNSSAAAAGSRGIMSRLHFLREWRSELEHAEILLKPAPVHIKKWFYRQAVVAVMLMTLRYVPNRADEFWEAAISGENLTVGMPAMTLRNYLSRNPTKGIPEHVYARYVANCWNGFYRRENLIRVQVHTDGLIDLIVIDGTPLSRGRRERERIARIEAARASRANRRKEVEQNRRITDEEAND